MPQNPEFRYHERLWPSFGVWFGTAFVLMMIDVAVGAALGIPTGIAITVLTAAAAGYWLVSASPTITVSDAEIRAGRAHISLEFIDNIRALTSDEARAATGRDANGLTFLVTRGWVTSAVRFDITDQSDPTPDWIVSTRHPDALAAALEQARRDATAGRTAG
jgi:hypothetical protein